ncbi:MAG: photosystem P840 reaction-center cytochrome c-551 [Gammaproteobacteria bacterium]
MISKVTNRGRYYHPLLGIVAWLLLCSLPFTTGAKQSGEQLLEKRCTLCHDKPEPGKFTQDEWVRQIKDMAPNAGLNKAEIETVLQFVTSHAKQASTVVSMAKERRLFEGKCSQCHTTNRVFLESLTPKSRRHIVLRMQGRAQGWISPQEAGQILDFLNKGAPGAKKPPKRRSVNGGAEQVFQERCTACHTMERVFSKMQLNDGKNSVGNWTHIVNRMQQKAPDWITKKEAEQILRYLQTLNPMPPN